MTAIYADLDMDFQDIHKEREDLEREHCLLYPSFMIDFMNDMIIVLGH